MAEMYSAYDQQIGLYNSWGDRAYAKSYRDKQAYESTQQAIALLKGQILLGDETISGFFESPPLLSEVDQVRKIRPQDYTLTERWRKYHGR